MKEREEETGEERERNTESCQGKTQTHAGTHRQIHTYSHTANGPLIHKYVYICILPHTDHVVM